jgi:site-specific DNA recombinase
MQSLKTPVVLYVRVSSDKQKEQHTVESQLYALRRYCDQAGVQVANIYCDEGVNGDLPFTQRLNGQRLLTDAAQGKVGTVLVYLYDRFSRDVFEGLLAARLLRDAGAVPFSIMEPFDINSSFGQYQFVQSLNNAELFKARILENLRNGMRRSARDGNWVSGAPPLGYRFEGKPRRIVPDDDQIVPVLNLSHPAFVRWLYQRVIDGSAISGLATELNLLGVPPPFLLTGRKQRSARVPQWRPSAIYSLITNPAYKGELVWGRNNYHNPNAPKEIIRRTCPALVEEETWNAAQDAMKVRAMTAKRNGKRNYLLSGLIRCGVCGSSYTGRTYSAATYERTNGQSGAAYTCVRSHASFGAEPCHATSLPLRAEQTVWEDILSALNDPAQVSATIEKIIAEQAAQQPDEESILMALKTAVRAKEEEKAALLRLYRSGRITDAELDAQMADVRKEENELSVKVLVWKDREVDREKTRMAAKTAVTLMAELSRKIAEAKEADFELRQYVVRSLIEKIVVDTSRDEKGRLEPIMHLHYRFEPPSSKQTPNASIGFATVHCMGTNRRRRSK